MAHQSKLELIIKNLRKKIFFKKELLKFDNTDKWIFENSIMHVSKKFFQIYGYSVKSNFPNKTSYDQPLISQNEVGYLVIFKATTKKGSFFLLQLKAEPGNKNIIQLSPTIQATKSNYTRVHKGKKTHFIEYTKKFKDFLLNTNQPEQGSRYLNKFNKNMIIKTKKIKTLPKNFVWVSKDEIEKLSKINNLLNMDTISILSCYLKKIKSNYSINSYSNIEKKYLNFKKKYKIEINKKSLSNLNQWTYNNSIIADNKKKFFKIQSYKIKTNFREINQWSQPLVSDHKKALNVLFVKKIKNMSNYLCQITLEPGYNIPKYTNTIMLKNYENVKYVKKFALENKINLKQKLLEVISSDEGGRFNNNKSNNFVYEVDNTDILERQNYIWISYNQMLELLKKKLLTIELRNLFGTFNIKNLK